MKAFQQPQPAVAQSVAQEPSSATHGRYMYTTKTHARYSLDAQDSVVFNLKQASAATQSTQWLPEGRVKTDFLFTTYRQSVALRAQQVPDSLRNPAVDPFVLQSLAETRARLNATHVAQPLQSKERVFSVVQQQKEWMIPVLLLAVVLLGSVRVLAGKFIALEFFSLISDQAWAKVSGALRLQHKRAGTQLFWLYSVVLSALAYGFAVDNGLELMGMNGVLLYVAIFVAGVVLYAIRNIGILLMGYVFQMEGTAKDFLQVSVVFTNLSGIVLLPLAVLLLFVPSGYVGLIFQIAAVLLMILYVWQVARGVKIIFTGLLSIFYIFLYLCALEILPVLWLYALLAG